MRSALTPCGQGPISRSDASPTASSWRLQSKGMSRLPDRPGPQLPIDLTALEIPEALSLLVAWREAGRLEGGEIRVASEVAAHLRQACRATIERLSGSTLRPYNADMHLESEEALFV